MPRSVVVDASPLIFLSGAGLVDLLHRDDWDVLVPAAVRTEILRRGVDHVTVRALAAASWMRVADVVETPAAILDRDLGPGESETLALGVAHRGALLVTDDRARTRLGHESTPAEEPLRPRDHVVSHPVLPASARRLLP